MMMKMRSFFKAVIYTVPFNRVFANGAPVSSVEFFEAIYRRAGNTARTRKSRAENPDKAKAARDLWRAENPVKVKQARDVWRASNPDKVRENKRKALDAHYFRPMVSVDAEGRNFPGEDDIYFDEASGRVLYEKHDTYLWGAAADDGREPEWLTAQGYPPELKRPLTVYEILDWLLALPDMFGDVVFTSFAFGYDATQILKSLPFAKVWQICKRETYAPKKEDRKPIGSSPVHWGEYAFSYVKGKWLTISHIRDRETNSAAIDIWGRKLPKYDKTITIYDTFAFYQSGFSKVVEGMTKAGRATSAENEFMASMKAKRDDPEIWAAQDIDTIKRYTSIELRLLAREMAVLRQGFVDLDNMRLRSWHGPGAAASAFLRGRKINKVCYPDDIRSDNLTPWQDAAHHAYHAGHIEMMKHGWLESASLKIIDLASAYPAATVALPTMKNGKWTHSGHIQIDTLKRLRAQIESASMLSMYRIKFILPQYEKYHADLGRAVFIPFYPLPYRTKSGGIIYPAMGHGWYMRDDVLALIAWLEKFVPQYPERPRKEQKIAGVLIEEAWLFEPASDEKPFLIVKEFFYERKRIQKENPFDTREKAIKLIINSIYGQEARYVGQAGKVPTMANPWYAAAITAATRRRLMEAALIDPHAIVFLATDGILSTRELTGLPRVRREGEFVELGDWEYCEADSGLFIQAGVYTYGKVKTGADGRRSIVPVSKLRGATAKNYTNDEKGAGAWLIRETLRRWRAPVSTDGARLGLIAPYKKYVTAGAALASPKRWKLSGRWSPKPGHEFAASRVINVSDPGGKRVLLDHDPDITSTAEREANRCNSLVRTIPVLNRDTEMSRPRLPEWLGADRENLDLEEQAQIRAGFN